jgi:putative transcriptional regulator
MRFHVSEEHLMDYAAGTASEAVGLLVATHLALCPDCRAKVADYERIGGAMLDDSRPADLPDAALQAMLARLDEIPVEAPAKTPAISFDDRTRRTLPEPLRSYIGCNLDAAPWRSVTKALQEIELPLGESGYRTRLYRIKAGHAMPEHTHGGNEMTLVLAGGFTDETGHYERGDVSIADDALVHTPAADLGEDCICLAVTDAPLKLTGPIGRIVNLFMRY